MDLFDYQRSKTMDKEAPLPSRLRPKTLEDFIGQEDIVGRDTLLYRAIKADKLKSAIFYGPPGTGKTTLAKVIANTTKSDFLEINATTSGIKEIKESIEISKNNLGMYNKKTIFFVDEIHRFNKSQQDALLPHVENGTIVLIGATTENPYFEVNNALISRSIVFQLKSLSPDNIKTILRNAISDKENGLGLYNLKIEEEALEFWANISNGDARIALNALELAVLTTEPDLNNKGQIYIDTDIAAQCVQKKFINYDKNGDNHYDTISAFIKSMRGSDPDAAVYYLARLLYSGEDPKFIARRIVICASEDVGNADPMALQVAVAAANATNFIGMPESRIILSQAVIYIACAPKSNSAYVAIDSAMEDLQKVKDTGVPKHLKDSHYKGAKTLGNGVGYMYPHSFENNYVKQQYLPDELVGRKYFVPSGNGKEIEMENFLRSRDAEEN